MNLPAIIILLPLSVIILLIVRRIFFWKVGPSPFHDEDTFISFGHRGAPSVAPDNTLPSFIAAVEAGLDAIELDVMLCGDGEVVVCHDFDLEQMSDGTGYVWERSLAYLRTLNFAHDWTGGEREHAPTTISTLDEVLHAIPADVLLNIELKAPRWRSLGLEEKVVEILRRHSRVETVIVSSFNPWWLVRVRRLEPKLRLGYLWWDQQVPRPIRKPWFINWVRPDYLHAALSVVSEELIERCHRRGMKVHVWTVNNRHMMNYIRELGTDGVFTDYPELAEP